MARIVKPLTDNQVKGAKPKDKDFTISDGNGLQLLIKTNGSKLWEFLYIRPATQKRGKTSFGVYPNVSLVNARKKRNEYQSLIQNSIDPVEYFKAEKIKIKEIEAKQRNTIKLVSESFFKRELETKHISEIHQKQDISKVYNHFTKYLSKKEDTLINDITFEDTIKILKKLENKNQLETLFRTKIIIIRLFKYAYAENIISSVELFGKLGVYKFKERKKEDIKNNPTYTNKEDIKRLYNDILNYKNIFTKYLLILTIHTAQRQGTLIKAKWSDFDFSKKLWSIPKEDMKMKKPHIIPLSEILINYLKELYTFTGSGVYLFPNTQITAIRNKNPYTSNNTATQALRNMGHPKEKQTSHGFRAMFKTVCKEHQQSDNLANEFVERILAHKVDGEVEGRYNRADNIKDMRLILKWWSEYLENLRD